MNYLLAVKITGCRKNLFSNKFIMARKMSYKNSVHRITSLLFIINILLNLVFML